MKIAPLKVSDPWFGRVISDSNVHADTLVGVPMESTVEMELVELLHGGPDTNYRPYLHLRGELVAARPEVELPYGVDELALRQGSGLSIDAFYEFKQEQLVELVSKGYFTESFAVPNEMSGIPWTLPVKADFLVVAPELTTDPPLVFMNVQDQNSLEYDEDSSGYQLSEYFPDVTSETQAEVTEPATDVERSFGGAALDLLGEDDLEEQRAPATGLDLALDEEEDEPETRRALVPDGVFDRLIAELSGDELVEVADTEDEHEEAVIQPGSAADVYLSRVSPGVEQVLAGEHLAVDDDVTTPEMSESDEPLEQSATGVLDLDLDEVEPKVVPLIEHSGVSREDHRRAAERRVARARAELEVEDAIETGSQVQQDL